jgi:hypothetical protein
MGRREISSANALNSKEGTTMEVPLIKCVRRGYLIEYDKIPDHIKHLLKEHYAKIDDRDKLAKQFGWNAP